LPHHDLGAEIYIAFPCGKNFARSHGTHRCPDVPLTAWTSLKSALRK
jgi:hypothetical protein